MRYWLRNLWSNREDFRWSKKTLGVVHMCTTIFLWREWEMSLFCGPNIAKSKWTLSLLSREGSCFSKQEYLDSAWEVRYGFACSVSAECAAGYLWNAGWPQTHFHVYYSIPLGGEALNRSVHNGRVSMQALLPASANSPGKHAIPAPTDM